jgi:hypothetical protein
MTAVAAKLNDREIRAVSTTSPACAEQGKARAALSRRFLQAPRRPGP